MTPTQELTAVALGIFGLLVLYGSFPEFGGPLLVVLVIGMLLIWEKKHVNG